MGNELPKQGTYFHFLCASTAALRADSLLKIGKNLQMEFIIFFFPERGVNFVSHRKCFCNRSQVIWHAQARSTGAQSAFILDHIKALILHLCP